MMSKLKLDVDALEVTSFDTDVTAQARGTVNAASGTGPPSVLPATELAPCPNETVITGPCCDHTLMLSCVQTCDVVTCGPTV